MPLSEMKDILYILPLWMLGVPPRCPATVYPSQIASAEESPDDTSFQDGKYPWMAPVDTEMIPNPTWDRDGPPHLRCHLRTDSPSSHSQSRTLPNKPQFPSHVLRERNCNGQVLSRWKVNAQVPLPSLV